MLADAIHALLTRSDLPAGTLAVDSPAPLSDGTSAADRRPRMYFARLPFEQPPTEPVQVALVAIPDTEPLRVLGADSVYLWRTGMQIRARALAGGGHRRAIRALHEIAVRIQGVTAGSTLPADLTVPPYDGWLALHGVAAAAETLGACQVTVSPSFLEQDPKGRQVYVMSARFEHRPVA